MKCHLLLYGLFYWFFLQLSPDIQGFVHNVIAQDSDEEVLLRYVYDIILCVLKLHACMNQCVSKLHLVTVQQNLVLFVLMIKFTYIHCLQATDPLLEYLHRNLQTFVSHLYPAVLKM